MMRIGHGYDVHRFSITESNQGIFLGGVHIEYEFHLLAHSDGDVVIHALCDALLGAAALGDIGKHFPDTDPIYKGIDSSKLLVKVNELIMSEGYSIGNVDISIEAEKPKLSKYISIMCRTLSGLLNIDVNSVNVKATTTEGLGFVGRSEGIAVNAVVLIHDAK